MKRIAIAAASGALALTGTGLLASPAEAARPLFTGGLVNVTVTDVIGDITVARNDVGVGVAAGVAATVCDLNVGGILGELRDTGRAVCTSETSGETVTITQ